MPTLTQDLTYASRQLRKSPGFALVAILTLALGIGGVTAVFSIVESVLLRPLPFPNSQQIVSIHENIQGDSHEMRVTAPDILIFQRESRVFTGVSGFISSGFELAGAGAPFQARAERVSASLFPMLGIRPALGRTFTQQEDESSAPVAVISYALWKDRLNANPGVLNTTIDLDRRPYTIIGVMPRDFEFPLDAGRLSHRDLWVPLSLTPVEKASEGDNFDYSLVARLKPSTSTAQAQQDAQHEIDRIIRGIQSQYSAKDSIQLHGRFVPLHDEVVHQARPLLRILLGAVLLILLIACANLASLLLVRAAGRKREFGVRLALGATRRNMLRQMLTEGLLLSTLGGAAGAALAILLVRAAAAYLPDSLPRLAEIQVSWPLLWAALALAVLTGLLCGLAPAVESMRVQILDSLRSGSQSAGQSRSLGRLRGAMVMLEVALAMILLVASGLLLRSFAKMLQVDPGFEPAHALTASITLPLHSYPTQQSVDSFYAELQRRLESKPGVQSVGFSSNIPIVGQRSGRLIAPEGYVSHPGEGMLIASNYLTLGNYFAAARIPLIRGRYFQPSDDQPGAPLVTVISQSLATRYFPGKDPIGLHIKTGSSYNSPMPATTIVGVVGDIKQGALDEATVPEMYEPLSQAARDLGPLAAMIGVAGDMEVVLRTQPRIQSDPAAMELSLSKGVHSLDPQLAVSNLKTMDEVVAATESSRRFNTILLTSFAAIALLLSLLGIYGVLAYSVTERTREIALRMALGATRQSVLFRTLRYALTLSTVGLAAGLIASAALTRLLATLLFDVKPLDPAVLAVSILVLLACSALAAWLPARRAASIQPMQALRTE